MLAPALDKIGNACGPDLAAQLSKRMSVWLYRSGRPCHEEYQPGSYGPPDDSRPSLPFCEAKPCAITSTDAGAKP